VTRRWELLDLSSAESRVKSLQLARSVAPKAGLGARFYNIEWKLGPDPDWARIRAYVLMDGSRARGFALFCRQNRPLVFRLGEVTIGSARLSRLTTIGDLYFEPGAGADPQAAAAKDLLELVLSSLAPGEALFFEGLPMDRATHGVLVGNELGVVTIQLGAAFDHQFIAFPASFKEYLQQLGSRSRQSVQYSARRLDKDTGGQVQVVRFDGTQGVEKFLTDAAAISRKTYQANLLGLGIHADPGTRALLGHAAEKGWLRSYILYCQNVPSAFMLGFQYGGCYYYDDVGYDPAYAKWSVGSVLQLKVIEEILGSPEPPGHFDFSTGFGQHKGRFGNMERREVNLLVLPRTVRNRALALAYRGSESVSSGMVRALDRMGVKDRVKKFIRGWGRA
jgi:Acetyltransferase (GNAT) domain